MWTLRGAYLALMLSSPALAVAQVPAAAQALPATVSGIPVNYDESKTGTYTLPDPLKLNNGKPVHDAKTWTTKRRSEIVEIFETQQYGRAPGRPAAESFDVFDKGTPALNGKAIRKQVTIYLTNDHTGPRINLLVYMPAAAKKPAPMLLSISFGAVSNAANDPGVKPSDIWDPKTNTRIPAPKSKGFGRLEVEPLLAAGFGFATFYYGDVDPDYAEGFSNGIRSRYLKPGQTVPAPDEWALSPPGHGA